MSTDEISRLEQEILNLEFEKDELARQIERLNTRKTEIDGSDQFKLHDYLQTCEILQQHSNLPSLDMEKRLGLVKMFYPEMTISGIRKDQENLEFTITFKYYLEFKLTIGFSQHQVEKLDIEKSKQSMVAEMGEINKLIELCTIRKDVSLFIYATNSYIGLVKKRIEVWTQTVDKFGSTFRMNDMDANMLNNRLAVFARLKNCQFITIAKDKFQLIISWKLALDSQDPEFTGDFKSKMECLYTKDGQTTNLNDTLNVLVKADGMVSAITQLLQTVND
ncbi:hypothetical protein OGAPHI_002650 [Ogataea philodendri]|uniref:Uncharacterized protein n=1 Tax=Ogataea philodendri TaxID=1378263 RepID=A0A9P8PBZ4_9ASCO|nr:uncharacterized protein OGAPHI_002650 [Ogataea philodendri]KAH3668895.1 hypothetical protein OGAPHI_002650 [Ogataea philodendri]